MAAARILVVDDDPAILNLIVRFLSQKNYEMESAADGKSAWATFQTFKPDLVILDVNLPDILGYALCAQMQEHQDVYILMLTSRTDASDKIRGFSQGADDYLTKPFDILELEHRVGAILRRQRIAPTAQNNSDTLNFANLTIDPVRRQVKVSNDEVHLTALEFDLLHFLAKNANKVWRRSELIQEVWGYDYVGDQRVVDVHIGQIRRKLESTPHQQATIKTVRGVGYVFDVKSEPEP
ncbi:response regulator transcription factor [[Limnothrix rosea] IAM M-220]|uniref:response regulator transcription factor n=1 Tax=[Limnothrix rosea] IAM M-220 TaxID=454133 RepID=UPI000967CA9C|nr:response regulator transcription factor [[Limnothrix rosea] IAM M-220]OKH19091.1 DNA-binding response regulator [[Limnothrix rosea] IAM M-220]